jgi:hypothetical protein
MMVGLPAQQGYPQGQGVYAAAQPPWSQGQMVPQQAGGQAFNPVGRSVASDRLPPQPDMIRRPTAPVAQQAPARQNSTPQPISTDRSNAVAWRPIQVPTPGELGINVEIVAKPTPVSALLSPASQQANRVAGPDRFDLVSVTTWLDQQGAKTCLREKLSDGVQIQCSFAHGPATQDRIFSVHGANDDAALRELVQEVRQWKEESIGTR